MKYYCREIIKSTCILKDFSFSTAVSYLLSPCPNLPPSPDPHEYTSPSRLRAMKCLHSGFVAILTISHFPASDSINTGPYSWYKNKTTHYILEIGTRQLANASVKTVGWVSNHWSFSCLASKMSFLQNCLTHWHPELFAKKAFFWAFWCFLCWILAKLALMCSKMHLYHNLGLAFLPLASRFMTFWLGHAQKSKFWVFGRESDLRL